MEKVFKHNKFTAEFSDEGTGPDNRYFSFTGKVDGMSGVCGDRIAEIYPSFRILEDLHLAKLDGEPMHALENGLFHFQKSGWQVETLENYWGVSLTDEQKERIINIPESHKKQYVAQVMEEVRPLWKERVEKAYKLVASTPLDLTEIDQNISLDDFNEPEKVRALAAWLNVHFSVITRNESYNEYTAHGVAYQVLTDEEADKAWDESLDSYLDDCVLCEMPEIAQNYFDRERWKEDAKVDGRGHSLGRYDGEENEITDPETDELFFAYRC